MNTLTTYDNKRNLSNPVILPSEFKNEKIIDNNAWYTYLIKLLHWILLLHPSSLQFAKYCSRNVVLHSYSPTNRHVPTHRQLMNKIFFYLVLVLIHNFMESLNSVTPNISVFWIVSRHPKIPIHFLKWLQFLCWRMFWNYHRIPIIL